MRMQPFLAASSFCWNCVFGFVTAGGCVGTATTIDFGKQTRLSTCTGGACIGTGSRTGLAPPMPVLLGHLQRQIVLSEPL